MRLLREPLVHFLLFGVVVFVAHAAIADDPIADTVHDEVVVSADLAAALAPEGGTQGEGAAAVHAWVRNEVLFREAQRLGLDEGDVIVRRRLVQKLEFLLEGLVHVEEPDEVALERYYAEHAERYRIEPQTSFVHVFFARDGREDARRDAERELELLRGNALNGEAHGDPFVAGHALTGWDRARVEGRFGASFARELAAAESGAWTGPVESSFGGHLVRITEQAPGGTRPLREVRDVVRRELVAEARERAYRRSVDELVDRYPVRVESAGSGADRS